MPVYKIERFELHAMTYRVKAKNEADAIVRMLAGQGDAVDNGLDFIEVADDRGLSVDENRELADQLKARGISLGNGVIPSIRALEVAE